MTLSKPAVGDVAYATALNQNWTDLEGAVNGIDPVPALYGDGSDGAADFASGTTTLTEDKCYTTLRVQSGAVLVTAGYRVYARTSVTVEGTIRNNGSNGAAGVGGAGAPSGTLGGGGSGGSSGVGSSTYSSTGGDGGDSVTAGGNANDPSAGGAGGPALGVQAYCGLFMSAGNHFALNGGAGGGGGTSNAGGGGGGGVLLLATPTLALSGTIEAKGGNGNSNAGGGGGGVVILLYGQKTGAGTVSVAAGSGGTGATAGTTYEITV